MATDDMLSSSASPEGSREAIEDARMGHVRLDETRAKGKTGTLYDRISWLIELLTRERDEQTSARVAAEHERDAARHDLLASEQRRMSAENRAHAFELQLSAATPASQEVGKDEANQQARTSETPETARGLPVDGERHEHAAADRPREEASSVPVAASGEPRAQAFDADALAQELYHRADVAWLERGDSEKRFEVFLLPEIAAALADVEREKEQLRVRAVMAEQHKALSLMGRGSYAEQVEYDLRVQLAETEVRTEAAEARCQTLEAALNVPEGTPMDIIHAAVSFLDGSEERARILRHVIEQGNRVDTLRTELARVRDETISECARVAREQACGTPTSRVIAAHDCACEDCARNIEALAALTPKGASQ